MEVSSRGLRGGFGEQRGAEPQCISSRGGGGGSQHSPQCSVEAALLLAFLSCRLQLGMLASINSSRFALSGISG